ncbi:MAG: STAS domain-containing protein [Desulfobacteraceae bacterium]|nr:STAS domain-containing protein [Desulfobacteraceae bacterium]
MAQEKKPLDEVTIQPRKLTIYEVTGLRKELLAGAALGIALDLGQVEECDAAGLQLLVSLRKASQQEEKPGVRMANPSDSVKAGLLALGIEEKDLMQPPG